MVLPLWLLANVLAVFAAVYALTPRLVTYFGRLWGTQIRHRTQQRRELLIARARTENAESRGEAPGTVDDEWEKIDRSSSCSGSEDENNSSNRWEGVIGFFHPFCNAGGGGERVLWAAIRATQCKYPNALCVVYTGDHEVNKEQILQKVTERFNIHLHLPTMTFLYLSTRNYVLSNTWPHFTLLGQSLGSLVLGYDAFTLLPPDIFIDTMGYAFIMTLCKFLFPDVPTAAYVHYPTISTDMLDSLYDEPTGGRGVNAGTGKGWKGLLKRYYWHAFAWLYGWVGGSTDVVMTNSSWTQEHIRHLWGPMRNRRRKAYPVEVVYPPVAVEELERSIEVSREGEKDRKPELVYIAQFRPEKDHQLVLRSFAQYFHNQANTTSTEARPQLALIGSVRNDADEKHIYALRLLAHELQIKDHVTFLLNAPWDVTESSSAASIMSHLRTASVGINAMWNEHFGIGVVEYQAAGLISVVHNSGGPRKDIVIDVDDWISGEKDEGGQGPTGFRATSIEGFAGAYAQVLSGMTEENRWRMRVRARRSARRFSEQAFQERWLQHMDRLVSMRSAMKA